MKLRKWVVVLLSIILMMLLFSLAIDTESMFLFVTSKIIALIFIYLISRILLKYSSIF